jgi:cation-transporting ATPase E
MFLMKTLMVMLLAIIFMIMPDNPYPYTTDNMLLLEVFVIAVAAFALALQTNKNLITGKFLTNVIGRCVPGGITLTLSTMAVFLYDRFGGHSGNQAIYSTMLVVGLTFTGFIILVKLCEPLNTFRTVMLLAVGTCLALGCFIVPMGMPNGYLFGMTYMVIPREGIIFLVALVLGSYFLMSVLVKIMKALKMIH